MISLAALTLAATIASADVPIIDGACESAAIAIDIARENPDFVSATELYGSKAILIHALYADASSIDLMPNHALLITWRDGWGSALYGKQGDWYGPVIDPLQWRTVLSIAGERNAGK